jgi:phosphate transport system substrate-binding protein
MVRKIMLFIKSFLSVTLISSFTFCSSALAGEVIKIGGAGSALGSMKLLASAFEKKHPGIKVTVLSSIGSAGGIKAVAKGGLDIGLIGRPLTEEELKMGISSIKYSRTPLVFATKSDTGISNLSTQEIIRIFKGETETWPNGERVRLILRQPSESNAIVVREISPEMSKAMDTAMSRPWRVVALTDQETADMIEKTPGAFGFCTLTQVVSEKRKIKVLSYNNMAPMTKNLVNESYPVSKTHAMVTKQKPSASVKKFIDFVFSPEGRKVLESSGNSAFKSPST